MTGPKCKYLHILQRTNSHGCQNWQVLMFLATRSYILTFLPLSLQFFDSSRVNSLLSLYWAIVSKTHEWFEVGAWSRPPEKPRRRKLEVILTTGPSGAPYKRFYW
uniref:Uncharacterized protein n=1 Tax=Anguilla anguilla TaxID=7936 RepID=A0A0E9WNG0_ANGAN